MKVLVQRFVFFEFLITFIWILIISYGLAHIKMIEEIIIEILIFHIAITAFCLNTINFEILEIIWGWNKAGITNIVYHFIVLVIIEENGW